MSAAPLVDVVIAVHDPRRRVDRALQSLADAADRIRITVVCHGIAAGEVAGRIPPGGRVRVIEFADGVRSPAGPFNRGLSEATAEYVMIMGSDDFVEPGAIGSWIDAAVRNRADIQLAPLRHQTGELLANPLTRPWRRARLDPVRDRLFHRSAPLGLIRRDLVGQDPLTAGMPTGEDLAWSTALWTSGRRIDFDITLPAYVIGADAPARMTMQARPAGEVLAPVDALLASAWARDQPPAVRASLVAKLLRVNVIGAIGVRRDGKDWPPEDRAAFAATIHALEAYAPSGVQDLPRSDRALLDAVIADGPEPGLASALARHRAAGRAQRLIPRDVWRSFGRESVLRRYARYALGRRHR